MSSSLEDAFEPIPISGDPNTAFMSGVPGGVMPGTPENAHAHAHARPRPRPRTPAPAHTPARAPPLAYAGSSPAFMPGTQTHGKINCIDGKDKYGLAMQGGMICRQPEEQIYRHTPVRDVKAGRDGKY